MFSDPRPHTDGSAPKRATFGTAATFGAAGGGAGGGGVEEAVGWLRSLLKSLDVAVPALLEGAAQRQQDGHDASRWTIEDVERVGRLDETASLLTDHVAAHVTAHVTAKSAPRDRSLVASADASWVARLLVLPELTSQCL